MNKCFPLPDLACALLPHAFDIQDGAHDEAHLLRVWRNVEKIVGNEGGDIEILLASTLLHDCIWVDKTSPQRSKASSLAANKASEILSTLGWKAERTAQVYHAIEAHSYSANVEPLSLEAKPSGCRQVRCVGLHWHCAMYISSWHAQCSNISHN